MMNIKHCVLMTFLSVISVTPSIYSQTYSDSVKQLYQTVLSDYDPRIRPVRNRSEKISFVVDLFPSVLVSLDTNKQRLSIITDFDFRWSDEFLAWNSSDFQDTDSLNFRVDDIWHPAVQIGPSYDGSNVIGQDHDKVPVSSTGAVRWESGQLVNLLCPIDVTYYPFDTQECKFRVLLPHERNRDILLSFRISKEIGARKSKNGEWKTVDFQVSIVRHHGGQYINYNLKLQRRAAFLVYTSIIPLVLLFLLNTFVLLVPVCSGEKGSIAITFLLSFSVYISSISASLPSNSLQTPLVMILMTIMLVQSSLILLIAVEQSRLYHYEDNTSLWRACLFTIVRCRRIVPQYKKETDGNEHVGKQTPTNSDIFKCVDRVLFYITFALNVSIVVIFTCVIYFKLA